MKNFGFMQGRLVSQEKGKIQSFPWKKWKSDGAEFFKICSP